MEKLALFWRHSVGGVGGGTSDIQIYSELLISTVSNSRSTLITNLLQNQWQLPE